MLSDAQISRLLDVANAACHTGNVADARVIYEGVLALKPAFAPALVGKALSHVVVEAERILKEEVLSVRPDDPEGLAVLGLSRLLARRYDEAVDVLAPLAGGEGPAAALAAGLLEKARQA